MMSNDRDGTIDVTSSSVRVGAGTNLAVFQAGSATEHNSMDRGAHGAPADLVRADGGSIALVVP